MSEGLDLDILVRAGALWRHDGSDDRPHAELASGKHSNGYLNLSMLVSRPDLLSGPVLAWWLRALQESGVVPAQATRAAHPQQPLGTEDWVLSSAMGGVNIAYVLGHALRTRAGFTEKDGTAMTLGRFDPAPGSHALVCEDVISTGSTTAKSLVALASLELTYLPVLPCVVNRTGSARLTLSDGKREHEFTLLAPFIVDPADLEMWEPGECPLCAQGSEALKPKANWARFVG